MSQAGSLRSSGSGGSGVTTITGNTGGALSGSNINIVTANSTVVFAGSGTTETLDFGLTNLLIGSPGASLSGAFRNASVGSTALRDLVSGDDNSAFGDKTMQQSTTIERSIAVGSSAMQAANGTDEIGIGYRALRFSNGDQNIAIGTQAMSTATVTGVANIGIGSSSLGAVISGGSNIALGFFSGSGISGASSSNIAISNAGAAESNTIRIGTQGAGLGQQNRNFQAGIVGVTVSNAVPVVINSSTGQLGVGNSSVLSVGMNTDQSIAENTLVDIVYDTSIIDTASGYAIGTGIYTVPATGNYQITFTGNFTSTAGFTNCDVFVNKNGGTYLYHGTSTATVSDPNRTVHNASVVFPLASGDTVRISVFAQTSGGTNYTANGVANGYYNTFTVVAI